MNPKDQVLKLITSDSGGVIQSLEFDEFGNNVYWISPTEHAVKVASLTTNRTMVLYKGNQTHTPDRLTLASNNG